MMIKIFNNIFQVSTEIKFLISRVLLIYEKTELKLKICNALKPWT